MSKITRTPYNSSRWITKELIKTTKIDLKNTGECLFLNPVEEMELTFNFIDKGSYFKLILKEDAVAPIVLTTSYDFKGVLIYDDGEDNSGVLKVDGDIIAIPQGSAAGTYLDLMCDGSNWYCQGVMQGAIWDLTYSI